MSKLTRKQGDLPVVRAALEAVNHLEAKLGGRPHLAAALALAPLTKDSKYFLQLLGDPTHEKTSLLELCRIGDVLPGKLLEWVSQGLRAGGQVEAQFHISKGMGAVAADVMKRGAPHEDACPPCQGTGTLPPPEPTPDNPNPSPTPCQACGGLGKLLFPADPEARKLALEIAGLMPKAGGINITNQQGILVQQGGGGYEDFQAAMDQMLFGTPGSGVPETIDTEAKEVE